MKELFALAEVLKQDGSQPLTANRLAELISISLFSPGSIIENIEMVSKKQQTAKFSYSTQDMLDFAAFINDPKTLGYSPEVLLKKFLNKKA